MPVAWLLGGQCLSLADYVAVTGTRGGPTAAGGPFMLPSLLCIAEMAVVMMSKDIELRARLGEGFSVYTSSARHRQLRYCSLEPFPSSEDSTGNWFWRRGFGTCGHKQFGSVRLATQWAAPVASSSGERHTGCLQRPGEPVLAANVTHAKVVREVVF